MLRKTILLTTLILALILAGCAPVAPGGAIEETPAPIETLNPDMPVSSDETLPAGEQPPSPFDPLPDEDKMVRGDAAIQRNEVLVMESFPLQIAVHIEGTLPTPCHHLRAEMKEPDAENRIELEVFTMVDPEAVCIQVVTPFSANLSLGSFPDGSYTVWLNGQQIGEFTQ